MGINGITRKIFFKNHAIFIIVIGFIISYLVIFDISFESFFKSFNMYKRAEHLLDLSLSLDGNIY